MKKKVLHADGFASDTRPFSRGIQVTSGPLSLIFVSGMASVNEKGNPIHLGDIKGQTRQVFENMKVVLASAGATMENVTKVTVFLSNIKRDYQAMNEVRAEYFPKDPPASSAVQAALIKDEFLVEIESIAVIGD